MEQFIDNISHFPTLVYTILLGVVLVYWLLSILGAVDIEAFDLDVEVEADADVDASGVSGLAGLLLTFGLTGVPVSIVLSLLILFSWLICYFAAEYAVSLLPGSWLQVLGGIAIVIASFFLSIPVVARLIKPLRGMFKTQSAVSKQNLVGSVCTIKTLEVTETFGQGELHDGEAGMILAIRARTPNDLVQGDKVVIIHYNQEQSTFEVVPEQDIKN